MLRVGLQAQELLLRLRHEVCTFPCPEGDEDAATEHAKDQDPAAHYSDLHRTLLGKHPVCVPRPVFRPAFFVALAAPSLSPILLRNGRETT